MMKNLGTLLVVFLLFASLGKMQAQCDSKWGTNPQDSAECVKNYSLFSTYYDQDRYQEAKPYWKEVFSNCPCASKNIYIAGTKMYKTFMKDNSGNNEVVYGLVDTLIMIYDKRMQYFPKDKGIVLGYKGIDFYTIFNSDTSKVKTAYGYLSESIELLGKKTSYVVLSYFIKASVDLFQANLKSAEETFEDYVKTNEILAYQIEKGGKRVETISSVKDRNDKLIVESGVLKCDFLIPYFKPKFGPKTDLETLKKIVGFLSIAECKDDPLFEQALVKLIDAEPSAKAYYAGGEYYKTKQKFDKAVEYLEKAANIGEDEENKAKYYLEAASISLSDLKQYSNARKYAYKALENKTEWGTPYLIIGNAYASSAKNCGETEFTRKTVYWAAVDKFIKAKNVDPSITEEASKLINTYAKYFPNNEEIFFNGLEIGNTYKV
ncbi:MAG: tetratricopeptide repeat protein, partial [bacterium]